MSKSLIKNMKNAIELQMEGERMKAQMAKDAQHNAEFLAKIELLKLGEK